MEPIMVKQVATYNLEVKPEQEYVSLVEVREEGGDEYEGYSVSITYEALPRLIAALEAVNSR